jgi:hypothetical protein
MEYTLTMYIQQTVYTMLLYMLFILYILVYLVYLSIMYVCGKYMIFHLKYAGIYVVYALYIHSFLKPGPSLCCWSQSMPTRVWVIKSVLFRVHTPPWRLCQGKWWPTKGSTRLQPTSPLCLWQRRLRRQQRLCSRCLLVFLILH